jgi:hypothetical protein
MAPSPPCFRNNSLGYAGLPGECWIPVPLPPPTSSWQTFSRRPRDGAAEPINQSKPAVDVADHNCDRLLNINSISRVAKQLRMRVALPGKLSLTTNSSRLSRASHLVSW